MIWALAAAGLMVGGLLPRVIAVIPDREHVPAEPGERPTTAYRELAARPWLPAYLAISTAVVWAALGVAHDTGGGGVDAASIVAGAAYLVTGALGVAMAYIDLREFRLPDWLTVPAFVVAAVLLGIAAAWGGDWAAYGRAWLGAVASVAFYLLLALLRPADLGLGDVKLAAVLGLLLGWVSWPAVAWGIFLGFLVGGIAGIVLLSAGRIGRRASIPFGPAMLVGTLLALLAGDVVADTYLGS